MKTILNAVSIALVVSLLAGVCSCHNENPAERPKIEKLQFTEAKKTLEVGQQASVGITITPSEARKGNVIEYSASVKGIIAIDKEKSGSEGVVFTAVAPGSVVLLARSGGVVDYCDITVTGETEITIPYISLTENVLEIPVGKKRYVAASLQGGSPADQNNFTFSNSNDYFVYMESVNNTVVLEGLKKGISRVTIGHPKAQYNTSCVIFVLNEGENAKYITGENAVFMELGAGTREYAIRMVGFDESVYANVIGNTFFQVIEGNSIIDVLGIGASCTIKAKSAGVAKVQVRNQAITDYTFEFQVVVQQKNDVKYINTKQNFYIINDTDYVNFNVNIEGSVPADWADNFSCHIPIEYAGVIAVEHMKDRFVVHGIKNGKAVLVIENDYTKGFPCEILFIVQNQRIAAVEDSLYIKTSQTVIQMEAGKGAPDAILKMQLVGGTSADQNNFEWEVEDSSIITVAATGTVSYKRSQVNTRQVYEVEAVITAKKPGTARITISNKPKALNDVTVMVKVYPYGTFNGQALYLGGPSIIKLKEGADVDIYTPVIGGNPALLGLTEWESKNPAIAYVTGSGLHGNVQAASGASGVTKLKVSGENVAQDFEAVIVVYREGEEDLLKYIYTDNISYRLTVGQTARIPIRHPNILSSQFDFTVYNTNKQSIYHVVSGDVIIVSGYETGSGELIIQTDDPDCNDLTIAITVESDQIDAARPYSISVQGDNYKGMEEGQTVSVTIEMSGASPKELKNLLFSVEDTSIVRIKNAVSNEVQLEGLKEGQTVLKINHAKSINEKVVVVYVVKKGQSATGKVILGIEKQNHVIMKEQSVFLRLITNAKENELPFIAIKSQVNADNIHIDFNHDSMLVTGLKEGTSKITVWCVDGSIVKSLVDLDIYITVKEEIGIRGEIGFPDSIIVVKDKYKKIQASVIGLSANYLAIDYQFEDASVAGISGAGLDVVIKGLAKGETYLQVACPQISFYKKVLVICVADEVELEAFYYFTVPKNLYRIKKGDQIQVNLNFGENGSPANALYEWTNVANNDVVSINTQLKGARITGKNEGQAVIHITCAAMSNIKPVEIIVEVSDTAAVNDAYRFALEASIRQMSKDTVYMMPVSIYYGNEYYDDYDVLHPGIKMDNGYNGIQISVSDPSVIDAVMGAGDNSQFLRITARNEGKAEIVLSHDMIGDPAKILVVVYAGETPQSEAGFVFYVPKKHYLIGKDETREITVQTAGSVQLAQSSLSWTNNTPSVVSINVADKTNVIVTGLASGAGSLTVCDSAGNTETVYVSVSEIDEANTVNVATESVIILSLEGNNTGYITRIIVTGGSQSGISWREKDDSMLNIVSGGLSCVLYPMQAGITEVTVRGSGFIKTIVVAITETEAEKQKFSVMNVDQRSFKLSKGETVIINPYYRIIKPYADAQVRPVFDNKVVTWQSSGKAITFTAQNIGVQSVMLSNEECGNDILLTFEVDELLSGTAVEPDKYVYMTTNNPVILLEPGYTDYYTEIQVIGEYTGSDSEFIWSCDNAKVKLNAFGRYAFISVGKGEYKAAVTVKNAQCIDNLTINIIVGKKYAQEETIEPYLYVEKTVYTMNKSDSSLLIPLEIRNVPNADYSKVTVCWSSYILECSFANGYILVNARDTGAASIEARYNNLTVKLYVIIQEMYENGAVYLTTSQNYVITNVNSAKAIAVNLVNYEEPDSAKITWKSANTNVAHVIGSGKTVQVLGIGVGFTKLTASHSKAFNDIEIVVKVLPSGSNEDVCYLTTGENVIETYVSTNSRQISISKIGGRSGTVEAAWTVDNPSIVGVMGNNDIAYITSKKEGQARITVSDREAGTLDIVVVVRQQKPGDLFIFTSQPIVQITPMSSNGVLTVTMPGIDQSEEQKFQWQIYSQMPSDIEAARKGGQVVSIYAMGKRCTVNGIYAGTARIKVTHPKAAEAAYIVVQVTSFDSMRFGQQSVEIVKNDMSYVVLETPDYENYADKVVFSTDNPSVATVIGTHRVVLISAQGASGTAAITASIPDTNLSATVNVTVVDEPKYNEPEIIVNQSMFILNPREAPFYVQANIAGFGMNDNDSDRLRWEFNFTDTQKANPMLKLYPDNVEDNKGFESTGKTVLIEVQQEAGKVYTQVEYCTLTITHPDTSRKRVLYFQIQEDSNAFTISKKSLMLETGQRTELSCNILNGSSKDYEEVVWTAKRDSVDPGKDIVQVIGRGKSVQILGKTDGETTVTASYRGLNSQGNICRVVVRSVYYFNITYQNLLCFPGQRDDNGYGSFSIGYSVRPPNAAIEWIDTANASDGIIATIIKGDAVEDSTGTGQGRIYFDFHKEGSFILMGTANSRTSRVNITVKNSYNFQIQSGGKWEWPYQHRDKTFKNDDGVDTGNPMTSKEPTLINERGYAVRYTITPATASIRLVPNDNGNASGYKTVESLYNRGWEIIIGAPTPAGISASGYIYVKNRLEDTIQLKFKLYKPDGTPVHDSEYDRTLRFDSAFPNGYSRLIPVFQRISGGDSNANTAYLGAYPDKSKEVDAGIAGTYAKVYSESNISGGYLIPDTTQNGGLLNNYATGKPIADTYNLVVADGEEHYIILDKAHKDAKVVITNNDGSLITDAYKKVTNNGKGLSVDLVTLESGVRAIKISGGKDLVVFNAFETYYDPVCELSVPFAPDYTSALKYEAIGNVPARSNRNAYNGSGTAWTEDEYNIWPPYLYCYERGYCRILEPNGTFTSGIFYLQRQERPPGDNNRHIDQSSYMVCEGEYIELPNHRIIKAAANAIVQFKIVNTYIYESDYFVPSGIYLDEKASIPHNSITVTDQQQNGSRQYTVHYYHVTQNSYSGAVFNEQTRTFTVSGSSISTGTGGYDYYIVPAGTYLLTKTNSSLDYFTGINTYTYDYRYFPEEVLIDASLETMKNMKGESYTKEELPKLYNKFDTLNFGSATPTRWHVLDNSYERGVGNASKLIKISPYINADANKTYFTASVDGVGRIRRISYNSEHEIYAYKPYQNDLQETTDDFFVQYFNGKTNIVYNFLYNRIYSYIGYTDKDQLPNNIKPQEGETRNRLTHGKDEQKNEYAYYSNNINTLIDTGSANYVKWTLADTDAKKNDLAYSDISHIRIEPMTKTLANRKTSVLKVVSNQRLVELPLGGKFVNGNGKYFTLLNLKEKIGNDYVFKPSVFNTDVVVSRVTVPITITYENAHRGAGDSEKNTLTINVKYEINSRKNAVNNGGVYNETWDDLDLNADYRILGIDFNDIFYNSVLTEYETLKGRCFIKPY
jgi:hypothetical protein